MALESCSCVLPWVTASPSQQSRSESARQTKEEVRILEDIKQRQEQQILQVLRNDRQKVILLRTCSSIFEEMNLFRTWIHHESIKCSVLPRNIDSLNCSNYYIVSYMTHFMCRWIVCSASKLGRSSRTGMTSIEFDSTREFGIKGLLICLGVKSVDTQA